MDIETATLSQNGPVPVGHGSENIGRELFGKEHGALSLATGAEIPGAASKRQKVLSVALGTPNPGEASLKPATGQEILHRANYNRAQWSRAGFQLTLDPLITAGQTVES